MVNRIGACFFLIVFGVVLYFGLNVTPNGITEITDAQKREVLLRSQDLVSNGNITRAIQVLNPYKNIDDDLKLEY